MKRIAALCASLLLAAWTLAACTTYPEGPGWVTLIEGDKGLENWNVVGDANWRAEGGAIVADKGKSGFLVSKQSYKNFVIHAEFWAAADTNSGIYIRVTDPAKVSTDNSYEINIWDIRPDPTYATAAIVNFAAVPVPTVYKAGGQWNTFEIRAEGDLMTVKFNGVVTATAHSNKFPSGPFALQFGPGVKGVTGGPIKWRRVQVKAL